MAEMKNICGKIPMDLHEKVREEIELTESSTQKFLQQVIEEHFNRVEGKGEISMGAVRTVAVQVSEEKTGSMKFVLLECRIPPMSVMQIMCCMMIPISRWQSLKRSAPARMLRKGGSRRNYMRIY